MRASVRDLRLRAGELLAAVERGESVEITFRGRPCAKLVGVADHQKLAYEVREQSEAPGIYADHAAQGQVGDQRCVATPEFETNPAFGMWADRDDMDVEATIDRLRASRDFTLSGD